MYRLYKCSPRQVEDWHSHYILRKDQEPNVIYVEFRKKGLETSLFRRAYRHLIESHDSLRTTFPKIGNEIFQQITSYDEAKYTLDFKVVKESGVREALEHARRQTARSFKDLQHQPLIQGVMIQVEETTECCFIFFVHHIIADQTSLNIIKKQLTANYFQLKNGKGFKLENRLQLFDFFQNQGFEELNARSTEFWLQKLSSKDWQVDYDVIAEKLKLLSSSHTLDFRPISRWRKIKEADLLRFPQGWHFSYLQNGEEYELLDTLSNSSKISRPSLIQASLIVLSFAISGNSAVLIQSHFSNRHSPESQHLIGNIIGKMLTYSRIDPNSSFKKLAMGAIGAFLKGINKILFSSEGLTSLNMPVYSFLFFNYIQRAIAANEPISTDLQNKPMEFTVHSPLVCRISEYDKALLFEWSYHSYFYNHNGFTTLIHYYHKMLRELLLYPDLPISVILGRLVGFEAARYENEKSTTYST